MFKDNNNIDSEKDKSVGEDSQKDDNDTAKSNKVTFFKRRSFKFGSMATAFTAIFIVIVILLNVGLTILSQKYPISADLTTTKDYNLSSDTIKYVAKIKKPVTIKIFATQAQMESSGTFVTPIKIIQQYPRYDSNISIQYIDYDKNPTAVAQYSGESIQQGDVIVTTTGSDNKERYKHIASADLLVVQTDSSTYSQSVIGNKTEKQIDSALDYVTSTVTPTILFTTGHDEQDATGYQSLLKDGNYNISTVNTTSAKAIDTKASAIVIVAPKADFSASEITMIDTFLKNGGKYGKNIFVYLDPNQKSFPNLEEYIAEWGVKVGKGVIYDTTNSFNNNQYEPIATTLDSATVGNNVSTNIGTDVAVSMPLTVLFSSKSSRTVTSVISTQETSKLQTNITTTGAPTSSDKSGPFTAMTLSTWSSSDGATILKSNMIVSGSYDIINSTLLNSSNKNNSKVLLGIANTLMAKESSVSVDEKYSQTSTLSLTTGQRNIVILIFLLLVPLAVLIFGLVKWLRRRHL